MFIVEEFTWELKLGLLLDGEGRPLLQGGKICEMVEPKHLEKQARRSIFKGSPRQISAPNHADVATVEKRLEDTTAIDPTQLIDL